VTDHRSAVTGDREPGHILAEIKESKVFQFIITITTPEQRRGVLWTGAVAGRCTNFPAATGFRAPTRNLLSLARPDCL
jgi:hypothetical protein